MTNYEFTLTDVRATSSNGKRYARVRAVANGTDTYNSVFTENARKSLISQVMANNAGSKLTHADTVWDNIRTYLDTRAAKAMGEEKAVLDKLRGQLPMTKPSVGKVIEAKFQDDNTVEMLIEEAVEFKALGESEDKFITAAWDVVEKGLMKGVSLVFDNVKSFVQDGITMIDDLTIIGLDFVDKPAHNQTKVLDVFVRAAQESLPEQPEQEPKVTKMAEAEMKDVDKLVEDTVAKKLSEKEEAQAQAQRLKEAETKKQEEVNAQIQALEAEKAAILKEKEEALEIAKEAVERVTQLNQEVASKSNPHFDLAKKTAEGENPLSKLDLKDLVRLKAQIKN